MKNKIIFKAIPRIAGIIALVAIIGFSMVACPADNGGDPPAPEVPVLTMKFEENGDWNKPGNEDWTRWINNYQDANNSFDLSKMLTDKKVYIFTYSFTSDVDIDYFNLFFWNSDIDSDGNWNWKMISDSGWIASNIKKGTRYSGKVALIPEDNAAGLKPEETQVQFGIRNRDVSVPATLSFYQFSFEQTDKEEGLTTWTVDGKEFTILKKTYAMTETFDDREDVLHIRPSYNAGIYDDNVMEYDLSSYAGKTIELVMSMDVYLKKPGRIAWQIDSNDPFYPVVCGNVEPDDRIPYHGAPPLSANTWHPISGSNVITVPSGGGRKLYLSGQQIEGAEAYFANATITITQSSGSSNTAVTFSTLAANGSRTQTTTLLTLTFSQAIPNLSAENIIISGAVSGVAKGTLSGTGPTYILPISDFTSGGRVIIWVTKLGYNITPTKTVNLAYYNPESGGGGGGGGTFNNFDAFKKWFQKQNTNSKGNPFNVKLKFPNLSGLLDFLKGMGGKYVNLDLSGCNFNSIGANAFDGLSTLTNITFPFGINSIGQYAFRGCSNLTSVTFLGTIPSGSFDVNAFYGLGDLRDKYLAGGPGTYTRGSDGNWTKDTGTGGDDVGGGDTTQFIGTWTGDGLTVTCTATTWNASYPGQGSWSGSYTVNGNTANFVESNGSNFGTATVSGNSMTVRSTYGNFNLTKGGSGGGGISTPTGLTATAASASSITLSWNAVSGASGYYIYVSESSNGTYEKITIGSVTTTSTTVNGLYGSNKTWWFKISAYDSNGNESAQSASVSATTGGGGGAFPENGTLAQKLAWLSENAVNNTTYTITVTADESVPKTTFTAGKFTNVTILLKGDTTMRTVSPSSTGALFAIGTGVTFILDNNITLRGLSNNTSCLVGVSGTLEMRTGSRITGNYNSSAYYDCGGVYVSGVFNMLGGEISNNTVYSDTQQTSGGGVRVEGGTFTMSGGKISGNTLTSTGSSSRYTSLGAGVCVWEGSFNMTGGEISGNTASSNVNSYGGGVFIGNGASFSKTGGTIYGYTSGDSNSNTLKVSGSVKNSNGHAACVIYNSSGNYRYRDTSAGTGVNLSSSTSTNWN